MEQESRHPAHSARNEMSHAASSPAASLAASSASSQGSIPPQEQQPRRRLRICLVSDFFFPNVGGIESHLYCIAQELIQLGHKVVILTHTYSREDVSGDRLPDGTPTTRAGIRWLTNGLKVYYIPQITFPSQASLPTIYGSLPVFREIVVREQIDVVHGHQAFSALCLESILHARTMGLSACFTDHSLYGFKDVGAIAINKVLKFVLSDVDHVVCVSHTSRENTVLRASLIPHAVSVIPNAVIVDQFRPDPTKVDRDWITIVSVTRLVYNKGADLLARVIPLVCAQHPDVRFIIAGDGAKRVDLEQMRERHILQDRVTLLGAVPHGEGVRQTLVQGQIFVNTSLTEAFGTAMVEAACAGLHVVSTKVGGVPELLPADLLTFCDRPHPADLAAALGSVIDRVRNGDWDPWATHHRVRDMYSWTDVAARLERVYFRALARPKPEWVHRLAMYRTGGTVAGILFVLAAALDVLLVMALDWWRPRDEIEVAPEFDLDAWNLNTVKNDREQLTDLRRRLDDDAVGFVRDLQARKLQIPEAQNVVHVPSLEWILAQPRARDPDDELAAVPVQAYQSVHHPRSRRRDADGEEEEDTYAAAMEQLLATHPRPAPPRRAADPFDGAFGPMTDSRLSTPGPTSPRPTAAAAPASPPLSPASRKRKDRAARERERRKKIKEMKRMNGNVSVNIQGRVSGEVYLVQPTVRMQEDEDVVPSSKRRKGGARAHSQAPREEVLVAAVHDGYQCDMCKVVPIVGPRFECRDCPEDRGTDLCQQCYRAKSHKTAHHSLDHKFRKIVRAEPASQLNGYTYA
ncbi:Phosphatidylinositol N-acetylglucosaminyltransferase GPI3 subunit [Blastocladiella emersonii ATCC 22665]|nr:Phosphatidylinositol N-acetylglucosaminyltransferase GPI3 subunit [Blastocladiella emersonii ATCC 22665]